MSPKRRDPLDDELLDDDSDDDDFEVEPFTLADFARGLGMAMDDMNYTAKVFSLTVSESKRLIARGIAADPRVQNALQEGMVAVCKGSTNAYVVEELLGRDIEKGKYVLGRTLPVKDDRANQAFQGSIPEVIFKDGDPVEGLTLADAMHQMQAGDVVLKGANALDYANQLAGVLVGHPMGGTMGTIMGAVHGKGLHLILPVGLEKQIATPLLEAASGTYAGNGPAPGTPRLWAVHGSLFTEIEALSVLCDVTVQHLASGGVCGGEGAVWLLVSGVEEFVEEAGEVIAEIQGEPSFWDAVMGG